MWVATDSHLACRPSASRWLAVAGVKICFPPSIFSRIGRADVFDAQGKQRVEYKEQLFSAAGKS